MYGWIIIVLIVLVALWYFGRKGFSARRQRETPLEILEKRFANGEITKEDYEEQKKVLEGGN